MLLDDVVIVVRGRVFGRKGVILLDDVMDGKFIKRFNQVGAWQLTVPNDALMVDELKKPGAGVIVYLGSEVFLSGPMIDWTKSQSREDPIGSTVFTGADDMVYLADAQTFPTPATADVSAQADAYDVRSGKCETVMKAYVKVNCGSLAPAARRTPIGTPTMIVPPDLMRGGQVSYSARFDQLGAVLNTLGAVGGLGYDVKHSDPDGTVKFDVYVPADVSSIVRMDIANDLLESTSSGVSAPLTTRAIIAGQGQGEARKFIEVNDADSLNAEQAWGRRIEKFIDQRNTNDDAELLQSGTEEIEENGRTVVSLKVEPAEGDTMQFFRDWFVGDTVGVVVDDQVLLDQVSEAVMVVSDTVRIGATIGSPVGYDWESKISSQVGDHEQRISFLEKNA